MTRQGFGTADLGMIAYECPEKSGMHLLEDAIVQVCDPQSGEPAAAAVQIGEIVATVNNRDLPDDALRHRRPHASSTTAPARAGAPRPACWAGAGRADEVTKVRGMFIHPRQADEVVARAPGVAALPGGRRARRPPGHADLPRRAGAEQRRRVASGSAVESAIRDVMKLRGAVEVVTSGTIPEGAQKIPDERKWD